MVGVSVGIARDAAGLVYEGAAPRVAVRRVKNRREESAARNRLVGEFAEAEPEIGEW